MKSLQLAGRTVLITGAGRGLGRAIARACREAEASIVICSRSQAELRDTEKELRETPTGGQVLAVQADISRPEDVESLFIRLERELPPLYGVVNNAGVAGPKGTLEENDWDAWVDTLRINLLGAVCVCRRALGGMRERGAGSIVNISGGGATSPMPNFTAYAASKAGLVRFTETLAVELKDTAIRVNAVAPGVLATRLLDEVIAAGPEKAGRAHWEKMVRMRKEGAAPPERAAALCVFLLSEASNGISGRLLSAVWDNWEALGERAEALAPSDVYTLRRIVPADRGLDWDKEN
jgi:NAD(P)-dependent dehydrogenase (short-subunit alcohol dehydrogenase family)